MDEAKARALLDKLTGSVTVDLYLHDDAEPHIEIVGAEEMILAFAAEVRGDAWEAGRLAAEHAADRLIEGRNYGFGKDQEWTAYVQSRRDAVTAIRALPPQAGPDPTVARFREELTAMVARADADGWSIIPDGHAQDLEAAKRLLREDCAALKRAEAS